MPCRRRAFSPLALMATLALAASTAHGVAPTLNWNVSFTQTYDGDHQYEASTTDASGNTYVIANSGQGDSWLFKYDASGALILTATLYTDDGISAMTVDGAGNIFTGGISWNGYPHFAIDRFPAAGGVTLWSASYSSATYFWCTASTVVLDGAGNVLLAGGQSASGQAQAVLLKFTSGGGFQWATRYGGGGGATWGVSGNDLAVDGSNNVYMVGGTGFPPYTTGYAFVNK